MKISEPIILYTSSTGGSRVHEATTRMYNLIKTYVPETNIQVVLMDIDLTPTKLALREEIWNESQKKVWPLLFVNKIYLGDLEELEKLNEQQKLRIALEICTKST